MKNLPQFIDEIFDENFSRLCTWVKRKSSVSLENAEDIALQSLEYACTPLIDGKGKAAASGEDWLNMAKKKAGFLVKDAYRRAQRSKVVASIDDPGVDEEGAPREEHKCIGQASYENWRKHKQEEERCDMGKVAMKMLPQIFAQMGASQRDRSIYDAVALHGVSIEEVCAKFGVNKQQVYTIRFRINLGLRTYGPDIVNSALAA